MKIRSIIPALLVLTACGPGAEDTARADLEASCEALVGAETGTGPSGVDVISTQSGPTGTVTSVFVAGAEAPWLCRADPTGVVTSVEYSREG